MKMSNANFRRITIADAIKSKRDAIKAWENGLAEHGPTATADELAFINARIAGAKKALADTIEQGRRWWEW